MKRIEEVFCFLIVERFIMSFCSDYTMVMIKDVWGNTTEENMDRYQEIAKRTRSTKMACDEELSKDRGYPYNFRDGFNNLFDSYED